jgi:hypothetical protein
VTGVLFSVDVKTGATNSILFAAGLSATANRAFDRVLYQTSGGSVAHASYSHNIKTGFDVRLSLHPIPEQCIWSKVASSTAYCAVSAVAVPDNYLDLWHAGLGAAAEQLVAYDQNSNTTILATPGSGDGGNSADIAELSASVNERYLSYITRGERELWGVRLAQ